MAGESLPCYALYAIRYATSPHRRRRDNLMPPWGSDDAHDLPMPMDFYVWLAVAGSRAVLIDSGADAATCEQRGHRFLRCPAQSVAALGVDPSLVSDLIITHMHWDHAGNIGKFPNARLHVHEREASYATGPCMCHPNLRRSYDVSHVCEMLRALYAGRMQFSGASRDVAPGLSIHYVGGHAPGMQVVRVHTERGWVLLASDAMHFYQNLSLLKPFPSLVNMVEYYAAFDTIRELAESPDHVVAGHDPLVFERYPLVPGSDGLAVALHRQPRNSG